MRKRILLPYMDTENVSSTLPSEFSKINLYSPASVDRFEFLIFKHVKVSAVCTSIRSSLFSATSSQHRIHVMVGVGRPKTGTLIVIVSGSITVMCFLSFDSRKLGATAIKIHIKCIKTKPRQIVEWVEHRTASIVDCVFESQPRHTKDVSNGMYMWIHMWDLT